MAALGGDQGEGLWCGASLRPWQILHSRLARMHTCSLLERDVWELMDETVEAAALHRHPLREDKKEGLQILEGDDGELWRHGGLMEARIRDWLISKIEEDQSKEAPIILHPSYDSSCTAATFSSEFRAIHHEEEHLAGGDVAYGFPEEVNTEDEEIYGYNRAHTMLTCRNEYSETWDNTYLEQAVYEAVADALGSHIYEEEEAEEEDNHSVNTSNAAILAAPLDTEAHLCQFSEDLQAIDAQGEHLHEEGAICAVCLENLYINEEELQVFGINDITRLPCRHSFHSSCLSPWLSASSLCPCCRAPITLSFPPHLEAPPNLGVASASCSDRVQREMMGLVAEVEAALDQLGLLS